MESGHVTFTRGMLFKQKLGCSGRWSRMCINPKYGFKSGQVRLGKVRLKSG